MIQPEDRVCSGKALHEAVRHWYAEGRRDRLIKAADFVRTAADSGQDFLDGMREAARLAEARAPGSMPRVFWARAANTVMFFQADSEEEVLRRFEGFTPRKDAPTPRKVLVKMAVLRIRRVRKAVVDHGRQQSIPPPELPTTLAALDCARGLKSKLYSSGVRALELMEELVQREDFDEPMWGEAWDVAVAEEVHSA